MKTEFTPLPDNDPKNISRALEEVYRTMKDMDGTVNGKLGNADETWQQKFTAVATDTDRLRLIASYLGLIK